MKTKSKKNNSKYKSDSKITATCPLFLSKGF